MWVHVWNVSESKHHTQVAGGWMMAAGGKADRKAVCELGELPRCPRAARSDTLYTQEKEVKTKEQMKRRKSMRKRKLQSLWLQAWKGPSSPFAKPKMSPVVYGFRENALCQHIAERRVDSYQESYGWIEVWKWSPKRVKQGPIRSLWLFLYLSAWDTILCPGDGAMPRRWGWHGSTPVKLTECVWGERDVGRLRREELSSKPT